MVAWVSLLIISGVNRFGLEENRPLLAVPVDKKPVTKAGLKLAILKYLFPC
jgi:hypothetical protein